MSLIYLDTETTGLDAKTSGVVEIALVNSIGKALLHTYVNPGTPIPAEATAIHGITDEMVEGAPTILELLPAIVALVRGKTLVIYNKHYDLQFLPYVSTAAGKVECCMLRAQAAMGAARWPKLIAAAEWAGYIWEGEAHSALADTLAARHVWNHIENMQDDDVPF